MNRSVDRVPVTPQLSSEEARNLQYKEDLERLHSIITTLEDRAFKEGFSENLLNEFREPLCDVVCHIQNIVGEDFIFAEEESLIRSFQDIINKNSQARDASDKTSKRSEKVHTFSPTRFLCMFDDIYDFFEQKELLIPKCIDDLHKKLKDNKEGLPFILKVIQEHREDLLTMVETMKKFNQGEAEGLDELFSVVNGQHSPDVFTNGLSITNAIPRVKEIFESEIERIDTRIYIQQKTPQVISSLEKITDETQKKGNKCQINSFSSEIVFLEDFFLNKIDSLPLWDDIMKSADHDLRGATNTLKFLDVCLKEENSQKIFEEGFDQTSMKNLLNIKYWTKASEYYENPNIPHNRDVPISKMIQEFRLMFEGNYRFDKNKRTHSVQVNIKDNLPESILQKICHIDDGSLYSIIQNCVRNAKLHGKAKNVEITFSLREKDDSVQIIIEDDGNGIEKINVEDIFKPNTSGTNEKGRGNGLAFADKKLILSNAVILPRAHGSKLNEKGAQFEIVCWPTNGKSSIPFTTEGVKKATGKLVEQAE